MQTQLVMVEGVPFSGKSTLSDFVALQLGLHGYGVEWIPEGVMFHRFFRHVMAVLVHKESISTELLWADWSTFVQATMASPSTLVVDGALSYAAVWPLLAADLPHATILTELRLIAAACAPLHPRVIHLTGDVDHIARTSYAQRGAGWQEKIVPQVEAFPYQQARRRFGVDGVTSFFQDAQALVHLVLEDGGWQTLTLDVTAVDWTTNRRATLAFLGIAEVAVDHPALGRDTLESYTGVYEEEDHGGSGKTLFVRMDQDTLALHEPNRQIGALVPVSATRFHVIATQLDTEFVVEEGRAQRLVVFTPDGKAHVYRRLSRDL